MTRVLFQCAGPDGFDVIFLIDLSKERIRFLLDEMDVVPTLNLMGHTIKGIQMEDRTFEVYEEMWLWSGNGLFEEYHETYLDPDLRSRNAVVWDPEHAEAHGVKFPNIERRRLAAASSHRVVSYQSVVWEFNLEKGEGFTYRAELDRKFLETLYRSLSGETPRC